MKSFLYDASACFPEVPSSLKEDCVSWEEQRSLLKRFRENNDKDAYEKLIKTNMGLVESVANKCRGYILYFPCASYEDLVSEGILGLMRAIKTYDEEKGTLATYAYKWIWRYITFFCKELSDVRFPVHVVDGFDKVSKIIRRDKGDDYVFQYEDVINECTKEGMSVGVAKECCDYMSMKHLARLEAPIEMGDDYSIEMGETIEAPCAKSVEDSVVSKISSEEIESLIKKCVTKKQYLALKEYYGIGVPSKTVIQIAKERGKSKQSVSALILKGLDRLRQSEVSQKMKEYV